MANIYDTNIEWVQANSYQTHAVIARTQDDNSIKHYYALQDIGAGTAFNLNHWGGIGSLFGEDRPKFIWSPSYGSSINHSPKTSVIQFDDGYSQRIDKSINNELLEIDFSFDLRRLPETTAITHFLHNRKGSESFIFTPPSPHAAVKLFICRDWSDSPSFFNNYSIRARFKEVAA